MDKHDVENALKKLAGQPVPELPANFEQRVWREIRSRSAVSVRESVWDAFVAAFLRPGWAISATVVTLLVSVSFGAFENTASRSAAHLSLNLGVFSADAPTLPSTLMTHTR
jgi:hypothetical protein